MSKYSFAPPPIPLYYPFRTSGDHMADETLLSAARRVVRFFQIDMNAGGLITNDTEIAMLTLEKMVRIEMERDNGQNLPRPDPTIRLPE